MCVCVCVHFGYFFFGSARARLSDYTTTDRNTLDNLESGSVYTVIHGWVGERSAVCPAPLERMLDKVTDADH